MIIKPTFSPRFAILLFATSAFISLPQFSMAAPAAPVTLERGPSADYAAALGGAYAQRIGDPLLAARAYEKAWQSNRNSAELFYNTTDSYFTGGDIKNINRIAKTASPRILSGEAKLVMAVDEFALNRKPQAAALLTGIDLGANRALFARQLHAWTLISQGKKDEAIVIASRSSGNRTVDRNANFSRALMYQYIGDVENAKISYETAFDAGARASVGVVAYARFLAANGEKEKAIAVLDKAAPDSDSENWLYAIRDEIKNASTSPLLAANARNLNSYVAQSLGATALGISIDSRYGGALGELSLAHKLDPSIDVLKIQMARILAGSKLEKEASEILSSISQNSVVGDQANSFLVGMLFDKDDKVGGEELSRKILRARPNLYNRVNLANVLIGAEKFAEAETIYSAAIAEFGDNKTSENGIELWRLLLGRGNARLELKKDELAIADMRSALALEPANELVLNSLGYTLVERKLNLDEALSKLLEAARLSPRSGNVIDSLGWAYFQMGRYTEAVDQLEIATGLEPGNGVIIEHLGDAYFRTGNRIEADLEWRKALPLLKKSEEIARVKAKIEKGLSDDNKVAVASN